MCVNKGLDSTRPTTSCLFFLFLLLLLEPHFKHISTPFCITTTNTSSTTTTSISVGAVRPVCVITNTHSVVFLRMLMAQSNVCLEHEVELCWRNLATGGHFKGKLTTRHDQRGQKGAQTAFNNVYIFNFWACKCVYKYKNCILVLAPKDDVTLASCKVQN